MITYGVELTVEVGVKSFSHISKVMLVIEDLSSPVNDVPVVSVLKRAASLPLEHVLPDMNFDGLYISSKEQSLLLGS
jgi:hypothetical protein